MLRLGSLVVIGLLLFSNCSDRKTNTSKELESKQIERKTPDVSSDSLINTLFKDSQPASKEDENATPKKSKEDSIFQVKVLSDTLGDCRKCDIAYVGIVDRGIDNLSRNDLSNFLCTIRYSCSDNVEFGEFSNEVLFKVLEKYPDLVIDVLSSDQPINLELILNEIANPVHDGINVSDIKKSVSESPENGSVKQKILASLQVAINRYN